MTTSDELERLRRSHALELALQDLRIADLEARVADLGKEHPEFESWRREVASVEAELAAVRTALSDTDRAFLAEVTELHRANEALRFDLQARAAELTATRAALTELAVAFFTERAALQHYLRAQAEDDVREQMDALDSFGLDALAYARVLEAQIAETGHVPWIRGLLLSAGTKPEKPVMVFRVVLNGHAEIKWTAAAAEALANPS